MKSIIACISLLGILAIDIYILSSRVCFITKTGSVTTKYAKWKNTFKSVVISYSTIQQSNIHIIKN